jgi:hypothetical protein
MNFEVKKVVEQKVQEMVQEDEVQEEEPLELIANIMETTERGEVIVQFNQDVVIDQKRALQESDEILIPLNQSLF